MSDNPRMNDADREHFAEAVEASFGVASRQQFFVWTQSSLQALLPHEILLCGVEDGSRQGMAMHRFSASRYFRDAHFERIADPLAGLRAALALHAEVPGGTVVLAPDGRGRPDDPALAALVAANELRNLAACLLPGPGGKLEALYGFARVPVPLDARLAHLAGMLVPHVHRTFLRVLAVEREAHGGGASRGGRLVTPRQEEILALVRQGKTNVEIARLLECSPWTIKNHVQAILRRLDSTTRTHAISRAMSLGILKPD